MGDENLISGPGIVDPLRTVAPVVAAKSPPVGTIYATPNSTGGVGTNPPGLSIIGSVSAAVLEACKAIPPGKRFAFVAVTAGRGADINTNIAAVVRIGDDLAVKTWLGTTWKKDEGVDWGAQLMWTM
jgi:hypothetical protein